jgi:hypothetical protein
LLSIDKKLKKCLAASLAARVCADRGQIRVIRCRWLGRPCGVWLWLLLLLLLASWLNPSSSNSTVVLVVELCGTCCYRHYWYWY